MEKGEECQLHQVLPPIPRKNGRERGGGGEQKRREREEGDKIDTRTRSKRGRKDCNNGSGMGTTGRSGWRSAHTKNEGRKEAIEDAPRELQIPPPGVGGGFCPRLLLLLNSPTN